LNPKKLKTSPRSRNRKYREVTIRSQEPQKVQMKHIPKGFAKYLLNGSTLRQSAKSGRICNRRRLCYARKFVFNLHRQNNHGYDKFHQT